MVAEMLRLDPEHRHAHRMAGADALGRADATSAEHHYGETMRLDPAAVDADLLESYRASLMLGFRPVIWLTRLPGWRSGRLWRGWVALAVVALVAIALPLPVWAKATLAAPAAASGAAALLIVAAAEVWLAMDPLRSRVLGRSQRARAGATVGGLLTLIVAVASVAWFGFERVAVIAPAVAAWSVPAWCAWAMRRECPRRSVATAAGTLVLGVVAVPWLLVGNAESRESLPQILTVLYFVACTASPTLVRVGR